MLVLDNNHPSGAGLAVAQAGGAGVSVYYSGWSGIFVGASGVGGGNGDGFRVTIVYSGPAPVRLASDVGVITAGARVTIAADGRVRPLQTRTVAGMLVAEGAPVLGVTLGEAQDGLVWVLVNPQ